MNLVPADVKRRELRRQGLLFPLVAIVLLALVLVGSYFYYVNKMDNTQEELESFRRLNDEQASQVAELDRIEVLKSQRQERLSSVTGVYQLRFRWSRMLDDLSFVVPEELSLTRIRGQVPETVAGATPTRQTMQDELEFEGHTRSMPDVAIFMVRLGLIPSVTDVTLSLAEVEIIGNERAIHFIITASLTMEEAQRPVAAPTTGETGPSRVTPTGATGTDRGPVTNGTVPEESAAVEGGSREET
ncbi:MAG: PilN domain-containing protein [Thermoleophilia bacterium]|nr:PilN domain-containing protein [Thermoleophilia bacterium]